MASSFANGKICVGAVYHSVDEVFSVLRKPEFCVLPEVQELISIFNSEREQCRKISQCASFESRDKFPFIVLEGLDGAGKTIMTKKLTNNLHAVSRATPPKCLLNLRARFDAQPGQLRRAFYSLGNYIAADEVEVLRYNQAVIMDRFWHSTAAYAIANQVHEGWGELNHLPPKGDPVYSWPADLLQPDAVLFLYVSEEIRNIRLTRRTTHTAEEKHLKEDKTFRTNLLEAYKRMSDPGLVMINANMTRRNVLVEINAFIGPLTEMCVRDGDPNSQKTD